MKILNKLAGIETEYACLLKNRTKSYHDNYWSYDDYLSNSYSQAAILLKNCKACPDSYGWGKEFGINGSRIYCENAYIPEISSQEAISARQVVAGVMAGNAILNQTRIEALSNGHQFLLCADVTDRRGHSYSCHLNLLLSRETFDQLFERSPFAFYRYWVTHLVTSIIYTGAGKIGSENENTIVPYQISQRADFIETARIHEVTTANRSLINSRDEALADPTRFARLHIITFDTNMMEYSLWLKIGTCQLVLAMLEANYPVPNLTLTDPVLSMKKISQDPTLQCKVEFDDSRKKYTAIEIQEQLLESASSFVEEGYVDEAVPDAKEIIAAWSNTLNKLKNDRSQLIGRIDWIAKLYLLSMHQEKTGVSWDDPSMKVIDIQYANISEQGLYYTAFLKNNLVERVVTDEEIHYFMNNAPVDTRAWFRSECLKRFSENIVRVDWDSITLKRDKGNWWNNAVKIKTDDPFEHTKEKIGEALDSVTSVDELLTLFRSEETNDKYAIQPYSSIPNYNTWR